MKTFGNFGELKVALSALNGDFEGYIQMSDRRLQIISKDFALNQFSELCDDKNFIIEAGLFCADSTDNGGRFIIIRQVNDAFLWDEGNLGDFSHEIMDFIALDGKIARIAQIYEEVPQCSITDNGQTRVLAVKKLKCCVFAGFKN